MMMLTQASYVFVQGMDANPNPGPQQQQQPQPAAQQNQPDVAQIQPRGPALSPYDPSLHGRPCIPDVSLPPAASSSNKIRSRYDLQLKSDRFLKKYQNLLKKHQDVFLAEHKSKPITATTFEQQTRYCNTIINFILKYRDVCFGQMTHNVFGYILNTSAPPLESINKSNYIQKLNEIKNYLGAGNEMALEENWSWYQDPNDILFHKLLSRLCRLKDCLKKTNPGQAKSIILNFLSTNSERCADGKGKSLYDLERMYVFKQSIDEVPRILQPWVQGGQLLFEKIQGHLLTQLKKVLVLAYTAKNKGRAYGAYAERRMINALRLVCSLPGQYEETYDEYDNQYRDYPLPIPPGLFLHAYLTDGVVLVHGRDASEFFDFKIEHLTKDNMIQMVQQWIQESNTDRDQNMMTSVCSYDPAIYEEYQEAKSKVTEQYNGRFFAWTKPAQQPLRNITQGITKEGVERILRMYGWIK